MPDIQEIAPDLFRLSIYAPEFNMQFNHFLVRDDEPLLFNTGYRAMFPALREAVGTLIDPTELRHIAWSHFESDECGALNDWLQLARLKAFCARCPSSDPRPSPSCTGRPTRDKVTDCSLSSPT